MYRSLIVIVFLSSGIAVAQNASTPAITPEAVINEIVANFSQSPIHSVQLTGTARVYAGSDQPSGTFSYEITSSGQRSLRLDTGDLGGTYSTGVFGDPTTCQHVDTAGTAHPVAEHNCLLPLDWVVPMLGLQLQVTNLNASLAEITDNTGASLHDLTLSRKLQNGSSSFAVQMIKHLTQMDFRVDPSTFLLKSINFTEHPEEDASTDFSVEVRYSDYRNVNGATLAFHIQKYVRGGLTLDLQVETAVVQ